MRNLVKVVFSFVMAMIIVTGNCSFATINNSVAKSTYLQLERKTINSIKKTISKNKALLDTNFSTAKSQLEAYGENLGGDLDNLVLKSVQEVDKKSNYEYSEISLENKTGEKVSLEIAFEKNVLRIQIPRIYEKSISVDLSRLKEVCEKFEIKVDDEDINCFMTTLENSRNGQLISKENQEYLRKIAPKYVAKLNKLLDSKYFSINKNAVLKYNDKNINCKSVSFEISMYDLLKVISELWNDVKKDEKLLDILVYINWGNSNKISKEELINEIDFILDIDYDNPDLRENVMNSTLFYNSKKEVLKREFKLINIDNKAMNNEDEYNISLITINDNKNAYYELNLNNGKIISDNVIKSSNKKTEHNITVVTNTEKYSFTEYTYVPYSESKGYKVILEQKDSKNFVITCMDSSLSESGLENKFIIEIYKKEMTSKKQDVSVKFSCIINGKNYNAYLNFLLEKNIKVGKKTFNIPEVNLNTISKEELENELINSEERVNKKVEDLFRNLFPNTMKANEERKLKYMSQVVKQEAMSIGSVMKAREIDRMIDGKVDDIKPNTWQEYSTFEDIDLYISTNYISTRNGKFYVAKNAEGKIIIGISNQDAKDLPSPNSVEVIDYDGTNSGVVYIEERY